MRPLVVWLAAARAGASSTRGAFKMLQAGSGAAPAGLLASLDPARRMVQIRRTLQGCPRQVLHLKAELLIGDVQEAGSTPLS